MRPCALSERPEAAARSSPSWRRRNACRARGWRSSFRVPRLTTLAQDRRCDSKLRVAACRALSMIREPGTAEVMRGLATDADADVRVAAAKARVRINFARHRL